MKGVRKQDIDTDATLPTTQSKSIVSSRATMTTTFASSALVSSRIRGRSTVLIRRSLERFTPTGTERRSRRRLIWPCSS